MKNLSIIILFISFLFSCSPNKYEEKLIGTWFDIEDSYHFMHFDPDSVIFDINEQKFKWKANKYKIFLKSNSEYNLKNKPPLKYEIKIDTLKITDVSNGKIINFYKELNYIKFLNKKFQLKFELPENKEIKTIDFYSNRFDIKIFIGYRNDSITSRTEISTTLKNIDEEVEQLINSISKNEENLLNYKIYADKNISDTFLNQFYSKLRKSKIKNIYRVYKPNNIYSNYKYEYIN